MMKKIAVSLLLALAATVFPAIAGEGLQAGFTNPPASAKPHSWWHWVNGNISREAITTDLEAMKRQGIQGITLFNVDMGYQNTEVTYLSPEWLDLFRFAALELKRLGMDMSFFNSAGWSTTGGPWITPATTMQIVVHSQVVCKGGTTFSGKLPQPPTRLNYYRDIAVVAFPKPAFDCRIDHVDQKSLAITAAFTFWNNQQPDAKAVEPSAVVRKEQVVDLTSRLTPEGTLEWEVPAGGEWVILRLGHTPSGRTIFPAIKGGHGLECDKLSREVVDLHWNSAVKPILDKVRDLIGSPLVHCTQDSYEAGCCNWTTGFDEEFHKRRGYDLLPYMPALAGYYVDGGEISERFLWDYRKTVGDLVEDNYYGRFRELCHENGLQFSVEPYGGPFETLEVGAAGDLVISEFWVNHKYEMDSPRPTASIAHLNGHSVVGAEAFTNRGGLKSHPAVLKPIGDVAWTEGVNRFIFHTFVHQPWNVGPGLTLGKYGIDFNRLNTWWEQARPYIDYVTRSQFLLQQGRFAADVLYFAGEESPNKGGRRLNIPSLGYNYDLVGSRKVLSLTVRDGMICTPAGGVYRMLVLPETEWMTPELVAKIDELAVAGATIIGPKPRRSPSLTGFPACDETVGRLADKLWDGGLVKTCAFTDAAASLNLPPDFVPEEPDENLHFIHRVTDDADIYFVATKATKHSLRNCRFRVAGKQPELWDPETGRVREAAVWRENGDGTTSVCIPFGPEGSVFVVFRKPMSAAHVVAATMVCDAADADSLLRFTVENGRHILKTPFSGEFRYTISSGVEKSVRVKSLPEPVALTGAWEVSFMPDRGAPERVLFDELISWPKSSDDGIKYYSGTAVYRKRFTLTKELVRKSDLELDLGGVGVIAEVILNEKNLGIVWHAPFRIDLGNAVRVGDNELEIRVTNLWPNRLIGDERCELDYARRGNLVNVWPEWLLKGGQRPSQRVAFTTWKHWNADSPLLPSGLIGPVVVRPYARVVVK